MEDNIDKYIEWVEEKSKKVKDILKNLKKPDISLQEVKQIASERVATSLVLNAEYQRIKLIHKRKQEEFNIWWSEKFSKVRRELNPITLPGTKYSSKSDIEAEIIDKYKEEYTSYKEVLIELESQVSFFRHHIESWKSLQMDITNLVKIFQLEVYDLKMNDSLDSEITNSIGRTRRRR